MQVALTAALVQNKAVNPKRCPRSPPMAAPMGMVPQATSRYPALTRPSS
jgi:hypothetical protein